MAGHAPEEKECGKLHNSRRERTSANRLANENPDDPSFWRRTRLRSSGPPGFHDQQYDPADERECSNYRRDKVAIGGLNVHSEEVDRLSRSREADARVGEHHDAESDQNDGSDGLCVHNESPVFLSLALATTGWRTFAPASSNPQT